jgi:hypothetical protein
LPKVDERGTFLEDLATGVTASAAQVAHDLARLVDVVSGPAWVFTIRTVSPAWEPLQKTIA